MTSETTAGTAGPGPVEPAGATPPTSTPTSVMPGAETTNVRTSDPDASTSVSTRPPEPVDAGVDGTTSPGSDSLAELQAVIQKKYGLEPDALDPDKPMNELGLDSLAIAEFLFEVEDHFAIRLIDDDPSVDTLRKLSVVVDRSIAAKSAKEAAATSVT